MPKFRNRREQLAAIAASRTFHEEQLKVNGLYHPRRKQWFSYDTIKLGCEQRMEVVDNLPPEERALVHEYGLTRFKKMRAERKRSHFDLETRLALSQINLTI